jgi:hypothetical protein
MKVPNTVLISAVAVSLYSWDWAQRVLSLDGSRTGDGDIGLGGFYLTSPTMTGADSALQSVGMTISTIGRFTTANIAQAQVRFDGLLDVAFTSQEGADLLAFVASEGDLDVMCDSGPFGSNRDLLAVALGVS